MRAARRAATVVVAALALPLAACSTGHAGGTGLVRDGCPADIRIATDDLPHVEWGFLYSLLDPDQILVQSRSVSGPLMIDGERSGARLTILTGDPDDGVSAAVELHDDDSILLAAVDTDSAILDAVRYPTVGVLAPTRRDSRMVYWTAESYPGIRTIEKIGDRLTPDSAGLVPFATVPNDPFTAYAIGEGLLLPEQVVTDTPVGAAPFLAGERIAAHLGDVLVDPHRIDPVPDPDAGAPVEWQLLDDAGYHRDAGVLSARPKAIVRYADCLDVLVPVLQRALRDYLEAPDATTELLVRLSAAFGDEAYDADAAAAALAMLDEENLAGSGPDGTIGDLDFGRIRDLLESAVPAWKRAGVAAPAGVEAEDIATNRFIDRSIG
jgi:hypothetical protein